MKLRLSVGLFALSMLHASLSSAQLSEGEKKAAARAAYSEGVSLQDKGNPGEALARFEAAQKLFDAPTHLLHIAECQALTGKLVEAVETYETLARKSYGADSPEVFRLAQSRGNAELEQLRPRVPTMRILVKPEPQTMPNLQIAINDKQLPAELVGIARPVNPGTYRMSASATGWGTPAPTDVEVHEKDASTVTLTLQKGVVAAVAPVPAGGTAPAATDSPTNPTPAPYDQGAKPTPAGPSALGLLVGVRPVLLVPAGNVTNSEKFKTLASTGGGVGVDLLGRVARVFLVGGTLEFASLGPGNPDTSGISSKESLDITNTSVYVGVLGGLIPNVDRVSFVGDIGVGMRFFNHVVKGPGISEDRSFNGLEFGLNAGLSVPVGPFRIMPKVGLAFGSFTSKACAEVTANCAESATDITNTGSHVFLNAALGLYYNLDFGKKPKTTAAL